jgi:hypothetical protein
MLRVRHFPPKPLEELHRCSPSVCDHFVRDSARVPLPLPLTVTVQHRLLSHANVSRMYAECFDKVLYHVNSRILKCKMTNVITREHPMPLSIISILMGHIYRILIELCFSNWIFLALAQTWPIYIKMMRECLLSLSNLFFNSLAFFLTHNLFISFSSLCFAFYQPINNYVG